MGLNVARKLALKNFQCNCRKPLWCSNKRFSVSCKLVGELDKWNETFLSLELLDLKEMDFDLDSGAIFDVFLKYKDYLAL